MNSSPGISVEHCRYGVRETTEGCERIIPELAFVGHVEYHTARPGLFYHHQHQSVLEIFFIVRGKVTWWVGGNSIEGYANELFLIRPGELHGASDDIVEPAEYYWIQVELASLNHAQLIDDLAEVSQRKIPATPDVLHLYQAILKEHAEKAPCCEMVLRETLHLLLAKVVRSSKTKVPTLPATKSAAINRALHWSQQNVLEADLPRMIKASGLTAGSFRKTFSTTMGFSPAEYLVRLRVQKSKELLSDGQSITETAHELGFSSSQYFATVFRKYEGICPTDFINRHRSNLRA